ncbi:polysaccharide pyruvyl transferase family protein [Klebsiella pasteurii]|uniref:polysaccharide pyruvyl transferase family protein n=1 Tax=Klebsiella pasteurii TaxID=2587529 RepID=UPI002543106C|nr:polysaccharide pyruvyl transferase family protein [Klebsiella pasteurii]WII83773.1 polysaccharide pyruvyl transferase family protein [Klebsiella pasteurii]
MESQQMITLKNKLSEISEFILDKNDVIFLDYPTYHNVGDLLIFEGTLQFFKDHHISVKLFRSAKDYDYAEVIKLLTPKTTIICQGGGNFGDIYSTHQNLRELVVSQFPNNRVIVLPQTAYYSDVNKLNESRDIFKKHRDLYLFARDQQTLNIFKQFTSNAFLSPDMAHALYRNIAKSTQKNNDTLFFLRVDCEVNSSQSSLSLPEGAIVKDWQDFVNRKDIYIRKFVGYLFTISNRLDLKFTKNFAYYLWRKHCEHLVSRSFIYFSQFDNIITSRMHGHILACLVDVPNKVIDNSYGKNSGYFNQWTNEVICSALLEGNE